MADRPQPRMSAAYPNTAFSPDKYGGMMEAGMPTLKGGIGRVVAEIAPEVQKALRDEMVQRALRKFVSSGQSYVQPVASKALSAFEGMATKAPAALSSAGDSLYNLLMSR